MLKLNSCLRLGGRIEIKDEVRVSQIHLLQGVKKTKVNPKKLRGVKWGNVGKCGGVYKR